MGNLVTNRYWSEFFLNEGFTVFIERKILGTNIIIVNIKATVVRWVGGA